MVIVVYGLNNSRRELLLKQIATSFSSFSPERYHAENYNFRQLRYLNGGANYPISFEHECIIIALGESEEGASYSLSEDDLRNPVELMRLAKFLALELNSYGFS